jgi:hypothetical protein
MMIHKSRKNYEISRFQVLDVLFCEPKASFVIVFDIKNVIFSAVNFFSIFGHPNPWIRIGSGS